MMDLIEQLANYRPHLDRVVGEVGSPDPPADGIARSEADERGLVLLDPPGIDTLADAKARRPRLVAALAGVAAAAVILIALFDVFSGSEDGSPIDTVDTPEVERPTPTVSAPAVAVPEGRSHETWSIAARVTDEHLERLIAETVDRTNAITSVEDIATGIRDSSPAVGVVVVDGDPSSWTAAMGEAGPAFGCDPSCLPGLVVWTDGFDERGTEYIAGNLLSAWWYGFAADDVLLSPQATAEAVAVAAQRQRYVTDQVADYVAVTDQPPPEPRFDTAQLGTEQVVAAAPEAPPPSGFAGPLPEDRWFARMTGDDILAYVVLADPALPPDPLITIDPGVLPLVDSTVDRSGDYLIDFYLRRDGHEATGGETTARDLLSWTRFFGPDPTDPADGPGGLWLFASAFWDDGVAAAAWSGLPPEVAAVAIELPDGTPVWQRPTRGIVIFSTQIPDVDGVNPDEWTWETEVIWFDADGNEIFRR